MLLGFYFLKESLSCSEHTEIFTYWNKYVWDLPHIHKEKKWMGGYRWNNSEYEFFENGWYLLSYVTEIFHNKVKTLLTSFPTTTAAFLSSPL